jgi:hypothetical protein
MTKSNYLSFWEYLKKIKNPVDMDTSIMCINILQNIKAVAPKLYEEIAGQTRHLYPDGRMDGQG